MVHLHGRGTPHGLQHALRHKISRQKIEVALRSIQYQGANSNPDSREGELVTLSQNGVMLMFRGNALYNAYIPGRDAWTYFKDQVKEPIKKHGPAPHIDH
ncbi:MAG: hypothetical protein H6970_13590 [Gammaproteobacteria bacterium]|nr:hypothetical protein [Gammaproteobacteria bacterium]MCP5426080.1 hypothetical protein [Gammaproteobacteria bacterium]